MRTCRCIKSPLYYPFEVVEIYYYEKTIGRFTLYDLQEKWVQNFTTNAENELYFIDIQEERDQKLNEILK